MRTLKLLPLFVLGVIVLDGSSALAERRNPLSGQPAIRNRIELRKLRFEITPQFLVGLNQDYKHSFGPGANLTFHITDWLGVGIQGSYNFNTNTALEDKVRAQLPNENNGQPYMYPGPQPTLQIHDQRVLGIDALLSAYAQLTPFTGKFALFSAAFFSYDLYADVGLGVVHYKQNCCSAADGNFVVHPQPGDNPPVGDPNTEDPRIFAGWKVGGLIGVGAHIYFNDFIGMQLELRDYIVGANPSGGDVNGDRHLTKKDESVQNNIFFGIGVVVMLPPKAKITH
jgi:outer membrane beta-barrel protein